MLMMNLTAQPSPPAFVPSAGLPGLTLRPFCNSDSHPSVGLSAHEAVANQGTGNPVEE